MVVLIRKILNLEYLMHDFETRKVQVMVFGEW